MIRMNEQLKNNYQNLINYSNADSMFTALEQIINQNGKEFILKEEHETEEECVRSYVARSNAMRFASEAIEHYAKAILIQNGHTWDESRSWGHNLLDLFNNLDEESRSIVLVTLMPLNTIDNTIDNLNYQNEYSEYENAMFYLLRLMEKYHLIEHPEEIKIDYTNNKNYNYDYINKNDIPKTLVIPQDGNIVSIKDDQTVEGELQKLNPQNVPGQPRQQLFGIKSRFPGQYLVEGNAEFLISLAYTMNKISKVYRKREERLHHI